MEKFGILVVCTGNICRSPAAQFLLSSGLGDTVEVSSAGTGALVGHPIDPAMADLLGESAANTFAARQLTAAQVERAALVLALTRDHRSRVVDLVPAAVRRTFTLTEFARICTLADPGPPEEAAPVDERLRRLLGEAAGLRPLARAVLPEGDDVPDPYRRGPQAFQDAYAMIAAATSTIIATAHR